MDGGLALLVVGVVALAIAAICFVVYVTLPAKSEAIDKTEKRTDEMPKYRPRLMDADDDRGA